MAVICVLEQEESVQQELNKYFAELEGEHEFYMYKSMEAFSAATKIFEPKLVEDKAIEQIDLILISYACLSHAQEDLKKIKASLKTQKLNPEDCPTRIIVNTYEDTKIEIANLAIDDFLFQPFEKLLLLQKMEIALNLPENTSPSFLALQTIKEKIEIGKSSKMRGFNEISIEIYNPTKISGGAYVHFYAEDFGEGEIGKALTRSYDSYEEEGQIFSRFDFFGIPAKQVSTLRKNAAKAENDKYPHKRKDENEQESFRAIIIDSDKTEGENLKKHIGQMIPNSDTLVFPSYISFLKSCFPAEKKEEKKSADDNEEAEEETKVSAKPAIEGEKTISCFIDKTKKTSQWNLEGQNLFLKTEIEWKQEPEAFLEMIDERQKESLEDFLEVVFAGNENEEKFVFANAEGEFSLLHFKARPRSGGAEINIKDITEQETDFDYENLEAATVKLEKIDMIFIDPVFIKNKEAFLEALKENIKKIKMKELPKIVLISNKNDMAYAFSYKHKDFYDYLNKPVERGILAKKILLSYCTDLQAVASGEPKYEEIQMVKVDKPIMLAMEVDMLSLSEFGISIRFHAPIVKDRFIHFYLKSFLGMKDHRPILARCYYTEEDKEDKNKHICYFTFLGVTDEVFKQIRLWMRDYYIKSKDKN